MNLQFNSIPRRTFLGGFGATLALILIGGAQADSPKGERVFTAGHSFHWMIPKPLQEMAKAAKIEGHEIAGIQSAVGGLQVLQHWNVPDDKNEAKKALHAGKVDVLTLAPVFEMPDEGIEHFVKLALEKNPNARILVQASWMGFDIGKFPKEKFVNEDRNQAKIADLRQRYVEFDKQLHQQIASINAQYEKLHKRPVAFIVPVGQAVMNLREKVVAGKVPGIAKQSDLFVDAVGHAKEPLAILNAYCHFAVIYKQNPAGLPVPNRLKKTEGATAGELNTLLQEIAWEAVTNEPASGIKK